MQLSIFLVLASLMYFAENNDGAIVEFSNQWVVEFNDTVTEADVGKLAEDNGFSNHGKVFDEGNLYLFSHKRSSTTSRRRKRELSNSTDSDLSDEELDAENLKHQSGVKFLKHEQRLKRALKGPLEPKSTMTFSDPYWGRSWHLQEGNSMNIMEAWKRGYTGEGITVSVVDNGVTIRHPDISPNYVASASRDLLSLDNDPTNTYQPPAYLLWYNRDQYEQLKADASHGTNCAGIIASKADNSYCSVGVAYNAGIGGIRLLGLTDPTDAMEAQALTWGYRSNVDIYSSSWGPVDTAMAVDAPKELTAMALALGAKNGRNGKGSIYLFAAGNGGDEGDTCSCDGYTNSIYTMSISSISRTGSKPYYTERCSGIMASTSSGINLYDGAPTTSDSSSCTRGFIGTSASVPVASGIVALTLQANTNLTWRDVQYITAAGASTNSVSPFYASTFVRNGAGRPYSNTFGFGLMDAAKMVEIALNWKQEAPEQLKRSFGAGDTDMRISSSTQSIRITVPKCEPPSADCLMFLEHVQVIVSLESTRNRGGFSVELTSPSGTKSTMLYTRTEDTGSEGFDKWPLLSLAFWGENPAGTWILTVTHSSREGVYNQRLSYYELVIWGVNTDPYKTNAYNIACDSTQCRKVEDCNSTADGAITCHTCNADEYFEVAQKACVNECSEGYIVDPNTHFTCLVDTSLRTTTTTTTRAPWTRRTTYWGGGGNQFGTRGPPTDNDDGLPKIYKILLGVGGSLVGIILLITVCVKCRKSSDDDIFENADYARSSQRRPQTSTAAVYPPSNVELTNRHSQYAMDNPTASSITLDHVVNSEAAASTQHSYPPSYTTLYPSNNCASTSRSNNLRSAVLGW